MKWRIISVLIVLIVLASLHVGCGQGKNNSLIEMLKILPQNSAGIVCFDIATLESDTDLESWYSELKGDMFFPHADAIPGINSSIIHTAGITMGLGGFSSLMMMFIGELDEQGIRDMLMDEGFEVGEYEGTQIWTGELYSGAESWSGAILEKTFLFGGTDTVEASIRVSENIEPSLYDNKYVKSVVDRLPEGIMCMISKGISVLQQTGQPVVGLAGGFSLKKATSNLSLELVGWYRFESVADAEAALSGIEDYIQELWDIGYIEGHISGKYIKVTGEMEIP